MDTGGHESVAAGIRVQALQTPRLPIRARASVWFGKAPIESEPLIEAFIIEVFIAEFLIIEPLRTAHLRTRKPFI